VGPLKGGGGGEVGVNGAEDEKDIGSASLAGVHTFKSIRSNSQAIRSMPRVVRTQHAPVPKGKVEELVEGLKRACLVLVHRTIEGPKQESPRQIRYQLQDRSNLCFHTLEGRRTNVPLKLQSPAVSPQLQLPWSQMLAAAQASCLQCTTVFVAHRASLLQV